MRSRRTPRRPDAARPVRPGARGMSLVEALIAMALLLLVAIGILPLFTRAMVNNAAGGEATAVANHARYRLEELGQLPFNNDALTVQNGVEVMVADHYFSGDPNRQGDEIWAAAGSGTGAEVRDRTSRVRQFRLIDPPGAIDADLDGVIDGLGGLADTDEDGEFDDPQGPTLDITTVHLKETSVELVNPRDDPADPNRRAGALGAAPPYRVRSFRAF